MQMFVPSDDINIGEIEACEISVDLVRKVSGIQSPLRSSSPCNNSSDLFSSSFYIEQLDNSLKKLNIRYLKNAQVIWKIEQIGSKVGEINEVYDVAISQDGVVYVAEWLNQRIQIFDAISGCSKVIIGQNQVQPWGITLISDGHIAVTDEKQRTVKIFNRQGAVSRSWKKQQFGWPRGITCSKNKNIVLTDTQHGRHTVNVLNGEGKLIVQFEGGGTGKIKDQFHWPRYVATDSQNKIIVSDGANHCVKIFDKQGRYLFKFGSQGSSDGLLKHPRGVCVDQADNILVADHDNDRVSIFNKDGNFVRHVLNIPKPRGLALNERGLLVVSNKSSVVLFKILDFMA
ncbi:hypothetical protein HELRODRAFT_97048 [Helobdella robusta]|uniref:SMP-30/Gluconolactonase/LRE-like region domain-containing protein n=1 Tax=Helobdella robusta TaxID=6412 RepID=T1G9F1_HELRO|nr:hypothetical protein HELRODRAFT_97048 [Helobdella robusta]ESO10825.1 hypothetical protein HELRODRAFT_97048 [Helobdella robusta]